MSSTGVVEHLDKSPERWAFLLRAEDATAVNVELRGRVHGTLAEGHEVELLESRTITADDVIVARRLRNRTLGSTVTARAPRKLIAFLVPQSIWTPIGGLGAAVFGYFTAGATDGDSNNAEPPDATTTPEAIVPGGDDGFPVVPVVLAAVVLVAVAVFLVARSREAEGAPTPTKAGPRSAGGGARFAIVIVVGVLAGVALNLLIT